MTGRSPALLRHFTAAELGSEQPMPVLVEFEDPPVAVFRAEHPEASPAEVAAYARRLHDAHTGLLRRLQQMGAAVSIAETRVWVAGSPTPGTAVVPHQFVDLFNGVGLRVPGALVRELAHLEGIRTISLDRPRVYLHLDTSVPHIRAPEVWRRQDRRGRPIRGEGVVIAVIDTGVDATHPAFGGYGRVPNPKVIHAVAYTGEPPADNFGHGTHVAGICAGDRYPDTPRGASRIAGVAPGAQIMSYKVLSAEGVGTATHIIMAIEDAVRRGAHVINLSLGDATGDPHSPEAVAANNAMRAGVAVCCAAGNAGPASGTVGSPGAAALVITVGAATDPGVTSLFARIHPEGDPERALEIRLMAGSVPLADPAFTGQYVDCGLGLEPGDFPPGVRGRIALIRRGEATFKAKARLAEAAGARAVLIYNHEPGPFSGTLGEATGADPHPAVPVLALSREDGSYLLSLPRAGEAGVYALPLTLDPRPVPQPDRLAEFSSRGPTQDGRIKPDLCAPGVEILSATITPEMAPHLPGVVTMADPSGYRVASGTSMATPHVAGACALLRQLCPDLDALTLKAVLVGSARYMAGQGTANDQGTGMLDLARATLTRHVITAVGPLPAQAYHFGVVEHQGERLARTQRLRVQDLGGPASPCRMRVRWLRRGPGLWASLSRRGFLLATGGTQEVDLTLQVDGARLPDGEYWGVVEASRGGLVMRLPFGVRVRRREPEGQHGGGPAARPSRRWPSLPTVPEPAGSGPAPQ